MDLITITGTNNRTLDANPEKICGIREADGEQYHVSVAGFKNPIVITKAERNRLMGIHEIKAADAPETTDEKE